MKENLKSINLGEGLGDLVFGMSREEVREMLGEPTEIDGNPFDDKVGVLLLKKALFDLDGTGLFKPVDFVKKTTSASILW